MGNDTAPVTPKPWNQTGLPTFAVVCLVIACAIALLTIMIWHVNQFTPYYSPEYLQAKDDFGRFGALMEIEMLKGKEYVRTLKLEGKHINDDTLWQLAHIGQLAKISLRGTQISDCGLLHLQHQRGLRELDLRDTAITDHGLAKLYAMLDMRRLDVSGSQVTDEGIRKLQEMLPDCQITR